MSEKCYSCNREWQERYQMAEKRFDSALFKAHTAILVISIISLISVLVAAYCVIRTQRFIAQFEYVEETIVSQDGEGTNVAVVGDNNKIEKEY